MYIFLKQCNSYKKKEYFYPVMEHLSDDGREENVAIRRRFIIYVTSRTVSALLSR